ncbi:MAG: flagellar brake protein [Lachnospiraceae bacterium]|nr:flagellar brake protein [Lachnospiraceae bacterium]
MLSKYVFAGDKVDLQAVDRLASEGSEIKKVYTTKVYDVITDDRLEVVMPMEKTKLILLPIDGEYDLCFYTSLGLYQCFARIIDRYKSNNVYVLVFELTSNLRKHQRRDYYRFSCVLDMKTRELKSEEVQAVEANQVLLVPGLPLRRSLIVDISGGGIRFISDHAYEEGSMVYCTYQLVYEGVAKDYEVVGRVLSVREVANRPGEFEHRVQYVNLDNDTREEIIKFIFEEERRIRRNKAK